MPAMMNGLAELPESAKCPKCGYVLRGLAEPRCPECGRRFDPHEILAFLRRPGPAPMTPAVRKWLRPPSKTQLIILIVLFILGGLGTSLSYVDTAIPRFWIAFPCFVAALANLLDAARVPRLMRKFEVPAELRDPHWRRRFVIVVLWALLGIGAVFYVPERLRFWISKPSLDRVAQQIATGKRSLADQRVGLYEARGIQSTLNGAIIHLGPPDWPGTGLVYNPSGEFPASVNDPFSLGGGWFLYHYP